MGASAELLLWKKEGKRWKGALAEAYEDLFAEIHGASQDAGAFKEASASLKRVAVLSEFLLARGIAYAPKLLEDVSGRKRGNRYLTGIQWCLTKVPRGFLLSSIVPLLKLDAVAEKAVPFLGAVAKATHELSRAFQDAAIFAEHWRRGEEVMRSFRREPNDELVGLYASYQTWEQDEQFAAFSGALSRSAASAIEVILEGPFQLYLMLADEITAILRAPIFERPSAVSEVEDDVGFADLKLLADDLRSGVERSEHLELLAKLIRKTSERAIASWREEGENLRQRYEGFHYRKRFVQSFEDGFLFRRSRQAT